LAAERDFRRSAEQERDDAIAAHQEAEERLREVLLTKDTRDSIPGVLQAHERSSRRQR
jgi:hypothetical protein